MTKRSRKALRLALIGWGAISQRVAALLAEGDHGAGISLVAIGVRDPGKISGTPVGARLITDPQELADLDLDLVVEAADREAVVSWDEAALTHAPRIRRCGD